MLEMIIISALIGFGFNYMQKCEEGMIFCWYQRLLIKLRKKNRLGDYLSHPLGLCIVCNTTWIGFIVAFLNDFSWWFAIMVGVASAALAIIIKLLHTYIFEKLND